MGGSQATVGQYLGEVQLNYSAPDPNLALYDIASVELLEGPQGTLYGTGALGGVMRVTPKPPELGRWSGAVGWGRRGSHMAGPAATPWRSLTRQWVTASRCAS